MGEHVPGKEDAMSRLPAVRESCIRHLAGNRYLKINQDFLDLCNGDHCAAAILAVFEFWTNCRRNNGEDDRIQRSRDDVEAALLGLFSHTAISERLLLLSNGDGYLACEQAPPAKNTYILQVEILNLALNSPKTASGKQLAENGDSPKTAGSLAENGGLNSPKTAGLKEEELKPSEEPVEEQQEPPAAPSSSPPEEEPAKNPNPQSRTVRDLPTLASGRGLGKQLVRQPKQDKLSASRWKRPNGDLRRLARTENLDKPTPPPKEAVQNVLEDLGRNAGCLMGRAGKAVAPWEYEEMGADFADDPKGFLALATKLASGSGSSGLSYGAFVKRLLVRCRARIKLRQDDVMTLVK